MEQFSFIAKAVADPVYQYTIAIIEGDKQKEELEYDPLDEFGEDRHRVCVKLLANIPFLWMSERVIVPVSLRKDFMDSLHQVHTGNGYAYRTMCYNYYWPGIREAIDEVIENCLFCKEMRELYQGVYRVLDNR